MNEINLIQIKNQAI